MVNKFVYDTHTSSVAAVSGASPQHGASAMTRFVRAVLITAAIGASLVGMGVAASSVDEPGSLNAEQP